MRRRVIVVAVGVLWALPSVAWADTASGGGYIEDGTPTAAVNVTTTRGGSQQSGSTSDSGEASGSGGAQRCRYEPLDVPEGTRINEPDGDTRAGSGSGDWYIETCFGPGGQETSFNTVFLPAQEAAGNSGPAVDPEALARQALAQLTLTTPAIATSPPADRDQLVNVPTWLWVEGAWRPQSATAAVGGVSVTVTATPRSVRWDMGTGDRVTCEGPGRAYDPSQPAGAQSTGCSYTYRRSSAGQPGQRYRVSARMRWRVRWTAEGIAGGGDLGSVTRSASVALRVAEGQALVTDRR